MMEADVPREREREIYKFSHEMHTSFNIWFSRNQGLKDIVVIGQVYVMSLNLT